MVLHYARIEIVVQRDEEQTDDSLAKELIEFLLTRTGFEFHGVHTLGTGEARHLPKGEVTDGVLACPNGHTEKIKHQEWIYGSRDVEVLPDPENPGVVRVYGDTKFSYEDAKDEAFYCDECGEEFWIAAGDEIDWL